MKTTIHNCRYIHSQTHKIITHKRIHKYTYICIIIIKENIKKMKFIS